MLLLATTTATVTAAFSLSHYSNLAKGLLDVQTSRWYKNKHLFLMVACAVFGRLAAGQRAASLEPSSCLIKKQTDCLCQKTNKKSPHLVVYL